MRPLYYRISGLSHEFSGTKRPENGKFVTVTRSSHTYPMLSLSELPKQHQKTFKGVCETPRFILYKGNPIDVFDCLSTKDRTHGLHPSHPIWQMCHAYESDSHWHGVGITFIDGGCVRVLAYKIEGH